MEKTINISFQLLTKVEYDRLLNKIEVLEKQVDEKKSLTANAAKVNNNNDWFAFKEAERKKMNYNGEPVSKQTDFIGMSDAQKILGLSSNAIRNWCAKGLIPYYRIGNGVRKFKRSELNNLMRTIKG